jgi:CDP-6-deoxy-D-xylo-4-hexulose-3-dehydrase
MARSHGWDRNLDLEKQNQIRNKFQISDFYSKYTFYDLAFNIRPTEINGFLGNCQLEYWDLIVDRRYKNFQRLNKVIIENNELISLRFKHMDLVSSFAIPMIVRDSTLLSKYVKKFNESRVEIRPMIAGSMAQQPFFRKYVANPGSQKNAEYIHTNSFYFGNNPELTIEELEILERLVRK